MIASFLTRCFAFSTLLVFVLSCAASSLAAPVRLNSPLPMHGDVEPEFSFTPDGSRVLYVADQNQPDVIELFSVPSAGGAVVRLNGALTPNGDVATEGVEVAANGGQAFYLADQHTDDQIELYRVPSGGGASARINGPMIYFGDVHPAYHISADGSRVAYVANAETNEHLNVILEAFAVSTSGGTPTKLNAPLVAAGDVVPGSVRLNPNGSRAFYLADQDIDERQELYSVNAGGGTPVKLNGSLPANGNVLTNYQVSANGSRVTYIADQNVDQVFELFSASATGGTAVKLNSTLVNAGDVVAGSARFSSSGGRVIYLADQQTDEVIELYSVNALGGTPVKLNGSLVTGGDVLLAALQFSPSGDRVLYAADQIVNGDENLFTVPATGGTAVQLTVDTPQLAFDEFDLASVTFSPNGSHVMFRATLEGNPDYGLFAVPALGGSAISLSGVLGQSRDVVEARYTPDGNHVIYLADRETQGVLELFSVPSAGGASTKISGDLITSGDVTDWQISPNSQRVVFRADKLEDDVFELFSVELADSGEMPGDFNDDGVVDAADYTVWRNGLASGAYNDDHYGIWKAHYGDGRGTAAGGGGIAVVAEHSLDNLLAIPEPASLWLLCIAAGGLLIAGRQLG